MQAPWQTEQWLTSPWNFDPKLADAEPNFGHAPVIHDVTLRDGEQQTGVVFTADDKVAIANALAEAGVTRIEAGFPAVSRDDADAVRRIVEEQLPAHIYAFSRCSVADVQLAAECGVHGVVMEIPVSGHLIEKAYRWPIQKAIDLSVEATAYAHSLGLTVSLFPIDATRADMSEFLRIVGSVARDGHMDSLGLVDTFGVLAPHSVKAFVREAKQFGVPLECHFHMDFGLGVANTLIAAASGVEVLQTTVSGIGERAGNTPMEETVLALTALYDVRTSIKTERLTPLARLVALLSGVDQPSNRPVTGTRLFEIESGMPAQFFRNTREGNLVEAFPFLPELVGQQPAKIVFGKGSGPASIEEGLERLDRKTDAAHIQAILDRVKTVAIESKSLVGESDFERIVNDILGR